MNTATAANATARASTWAPTLPPAETVIVPDVCRFADDVWDLTPLSGRPTAAYLTVNFAPIDPALREDIKHFVHVLLTTDTPLDQLERPAMARVRITPATLKSTVQDLKRFLRWLHDRNIDRLDRVTEDDLRAYALDVAAAPLSQHGKNRLLFTVSRLWLMAPYLRPQARLIQPFWERDGITEVIGKSEWSAENKSAPINPATMSALLVWCLRLVDDGAAAAPRMKAYLGRRTPRAPRGEGKWLGTLAVDDPMTARRLVATSCLITIAYLTGMRADELYALRRGCCTPMRHPGTGTVLGYNIDGRTFKAAVHKGRAVPEGVERDTPWRAIKPVADAIDVLEALHDQDRLFSRTLIQRRRLDTPLSPQPPTTNGLDTALTFLIAWCNDRAIQLGRADEVIPPDPEGNITLRRLRRTLAWFVYRRPRGRIALGIQYGHLHSATTDGYGSRVSVGLRHLFPMEDALNLRDTLHEAATYLEEHPTVSGPAARRYRDTLEEFRHTYAGLTLTTRQTRDLATNPTLRIYDGPEQLVAFCYDASKALCRRDASDAVAVTPDLTACDPRCGNIARTDRHIEALTVLADTLRRDAAAEHTPVPIAHRLTLMAQRHEHNIAAHREEDQEGEHGR